MSSPLLSDAEESNTTPSTASTTSTKEFVPKEGKTVDIYLDLVYEEKAESEGEKSESDETSDDDIPTADINQVEYLTLVATTGLLKKTTSVERNKAQNLVEDQYKELKINLAISDDIKERGHDDNYDNDKDFFSELEANFAQTGKEEETQLACKYLSISVTSVPSERLFSDVGNHISSKRTRLSPDLVNRVLFLKCNRVHADMFPLQE
ncbi:10460_t:CDS:2 [Cetraspora pellucida]|uniref:10460_t:CDS:1 n=1 Tax=Cetraspora pellucida TaxID=1433469 RepID=A0A9N9II96_9GLOM|nr:10460_t:CDS:2 [Cetraspora pellucida]